MRLAWRLGTADNADRRTSYKRPRDDRTTCTSALCHPTRRCGRAKAWPACFALAGRLADRNTRCTAARRCGESGRHSAFPTLPAPRRLGLCLLRLLGLLPHRQLPYGQPVQGTGRRLQMGSADMEVHHGGHEARMSQQPADRQDVDSRFQKAGRVGMSKDVWRDVFVDLGPLGRPFDPLLDRRGRVRPIGLLARKHMPGGAVRFPIRPQCRQQSGREGNQPLPVPFAAGHAELHPIAVDVGDLQGSRFGQA